MAKSVVCGGSRYLVWMSLAEAFTRASRPFRAGVHAGEVPAVLRVQHALVILHRELGVDGQPDLTAVPAGLAGQPDGETPPARAPRLAGHVGRVLLRGH